MRDIVFFEEQTLIKRILSHLGLWETRNHDTSQVTGITNTANEAEPTIDDTYSQLLQSHHTGGVGFIENATHFELIWQYFKPQETIPQIDFKTELVLLVFNTQFYNRISIGKVSRKNGVVEVFAIETLSARPIEDEVAMSMVVVRREGIKGIKHQGYVIPLD